MSHECQKLKDFGIDWEIDVLLLRENELGLSEETVLKLHKYIREKYGEDLWLKTLFAKSDSFAKK